MPCVAKVAHVGRVSPDCMPGLVDDRVAL